MKIFTCNDFIGFWPVGTAAVIIAKNQSQAKKLLVKKLEEINLAEKNIEQYFTIQEVNQEKPHVVILRDGDY